MRLHDQRGGARLLVVVVLAVLLSGCFWITRPSAAPPSRPAASLASAPDPLVRRSTGWAPASRARIGPGMRTFTGDGQCTADFVFSDSAGDLYLGQAAHCAETAESADGCRAHSLPLGTRVAITEGDNDIGMGHVIAWGRLAYSSWLTMQRLGDHDPVHCAFNDFALIRLARADRRLVNPSLPFWGGPTGLADHGLLAGEQVFGYGRSELRTVRSAGSRQSGMAFTDAPATQGWSHSFVALSPGIPGDSGSGYVDASGMALGTLSTLRMGYVLVNTIGDLRLELGYARAHSGIRGLALEVGTTPFDADR